MKHDHDHCDGLCHEVCEDADPVFPLETAYRRIIEALGIDVAERPDLLDTPRRAAKALFELTRGEREPLPKLSVFHEAHADSMVLAGPTKFWSLCEHHLLPFTGHAVVGYLPQEGRIIGLSKMPRIVLHFGARLQNQERMAAQIAECLFTVPNLNPKGVGVLVRSQHSCMAARGVRSEGEMITSALLGAFREDEKVRSEFLALARDLLRQP